MHPGLRQRLEAEDPDRPPFQPPALPRPRWRPEPPLSRGQRPPHLTKAQFDAIEQAIRRAAWAKHPLHISLKPRLFRKRYYLALIGGEDRRKPSRSDTNSHGQLGQVLMVLGLAAILVTGGLIGVQATIYLTGLLAA